MQSIPVYQQRSAIGGVVSAPRASSAVSGNSALAGALGDVVQGLGAIGAQVKQQEEDRSAQEVANVLSQGRVHWQQQQNERLQAWKPGDPDLRESIGKDFDAWTSANAQKLATPKSRAYFEQHALDLKAGMLTTAYAETQKKITDQLNAESIKGMEADEQAVFANPATMQQVLAARAEAMLSRKDLSEEDKARTLIGFKQKLALAAQMGQVAQDPEGWYQQQFGGLPESAGGTVKPGAVGGGGFDAAVARVLKHEGGYTSKDGNSGAPANFGINQKHNPDIDVSKLTKEGATKLYKERHWDAINGDALPPALQSTALDAAVNQGPANAKKWIEQSGGDPVKFNELRRQHYEKLLAKPEYAKYRKAWMGRLEDNAAAGAPAASAPSASFAALPWQQQLKLQSEAEQKILQNQTKMFATVSIETASQAVQAQDIGVSGQVDDGMAVSNAVLAAQARTGRELKPEQVQMIEAQVARAARLRESQRKTEQENIKGSLFDALDQNGGDYQALMAASAADLDKLPRAERDALQRYAGQVATGETRVTDWQAYAMLIDNPETLAAVNLASLKDKFSRTEYMQLAKLQESAKKAQESGQPQTIQSDMAVVKDLLQGAKIKPNQEKEAQFFAVLQREMDAQMAATGKTKMTQPEIKALAADLLVKETTKKGFLWDTKALAFEIEVPPTERAKITAALQAAGMPVNDSAILRAYRNKLQKAQQPKPPVPPASQPQGSW